MKRILIKLAKDIKKLHPKCTAHSSEVHLNQCNEWTFGGAIHHGLYVCIVANHSTPEAVLASIKKKLLEYNYE
jgi:hypothetical protein